MGTPTGLFHHRASLTWEWEETRFRGWRAFTPHHANRPTATELTWRRRAHPPRGYHHDSRPTATGLAWRARAMGTPTGLFHHRASLTWEWEETRFRGWCVFTQHHANRPTATELTWRRRAHPPTRLPPRQQAHGYWTGVARARDENPHGAVPPPGLAHMGVGGAPVSWLVCVHTTPRQQAHGY